jgi:hypothetical protein
MLLFRSVPSTHRKNKIKFYINRFEIALMDLPERLENRFSLYLNILPLLEKTGLYGSLSLGLLLSIIAVTRVALRASRSMTSQQCHEKYGRNLLNNSVYNACEEKLSKEMHSTVNEMRNNASSNDDEYDDDDDDDENKSNSGDCFNIIRRDDDYELENDDALSDIDYNEIADDEEESMSNSSSTEQVNIMQILIYKES